MNKKITLTVLTSLIATAMFALEPPPVGSAAPDFSLPDAKGQTHSLSQYKGKYVVLEWFNPECPFVKKHYGSDNMQKLQKEYTDKGVVWLTIDSNAPGTEGNLTPEQARESRNLLEDAADCVASRSGRQSGPRLRRQEHAKHGDNQPGRKNRLRRSDRQQGDAEPGRYPQLDELCQVSVGSIIGRQIYLHATNQTIRLLGQIQIFVEM